MDLWLVRTARNIIAGPYPKDQVCQLIRDGQLGPQDEVCPANGYWIFLHEREELKKFLGIEPPREGSTEEEVTQTETQIPEIPDLEMDDSGAGSTMMVNRPAPPTSPASGPKPAQITRPPHVTLMGGTSGAARTGGLPSAFPMPTVEKTSFWRGFAWLLIAGVAVLIFAVLRLMRTSA